MLNGDYFMIQNNIELTTKNVNHRYETDEEHLSIETNYKIERIKTDEGWVTLE